MIKNDVVTMVCCKTMYSRSTVEAVLDAVIDTVTEGLTKGDKIQFAGFGTFEPKRRKARTGRNPHTGEEIPIPARIVPYFKAGKSLKQSVVKPINAYTE